MEALWGRVFWLQRLSTWRSDRLRWLYGGTRNGLSPGGLRVVQAEELDCMDRKG